MPAGFAQTPAFPGAYGFGQYASGGRNGTIYHVTSLAASGPGTFSDAVSAPNRVIVFDVGGTITLASPVSCKSSLTIEGQTAPGGIAIIGHEVSFSAETNEIVRFVHIRPGSISSSGEDGIDVGDGTNMIFDHDSIEFAGYNNIDAVGSIGIDTMTVQNSIIADPMYNGTSAKQGFGAHSEHIGGHFTWWRNVWVSCHDRMPLAKINTIFINNVEYNYELGYTTANTSGSFDHDIINNYFITGPATTTVSDNFFQINANQSIYSSGNLLDSSDSGVLSGSATTPSGNVVLTSPWSALTPNIPTLSTASAYRWDVSLSGDWPYDQVDALVISQVESLGSGATGTGTGTAGPGTSLYDSQSDTGLGNNGYGTLNGGPTPLNASLDGIADYWKLANGLSTNIDYPLTNTPDGYTLQEHYFNWLASPNALTLTNTSVAIDLWQFTGGFTNASPVYTLSNASNGVVTLQSGHVANFVPATNFIGLASFEFGVTASDGTSCSNIVTICVTPQIPLGTNVVTQAPPVTEQAPAIFVCLNSSSSGAATASITPPSGGSYSAADQVDIGTVWNDMSFVTATAGSASPGNPTNTPTTNSLWASPKSLVNSLGSNTVATLSISNYYNTAGSHAEFSSISQSGGAPSTLFDNAWRIYFGPDSAVYTISNLTAGAAYDLYFCGSGSTNGQGTVCTLAAANQLGTNAVSAPTTGMVTPTVFNGTTVVNQGVSWNVLHGQADANGNFKFTQSDYSSGLDYLNGFQLQPLVAPVITGLTGQTVATGGNVIWNATVSGVPTPVLQWQTNGVNLADTTNFLVLSDVQPSQGGTYSLIASNSLGVITNSVTLTVSSSAAPDIGTVLLSNGAVQLSFNGASGQGYRLWASTNAALTPVTNTWTLLTSGTFGGSPVLFTDSPTTNFAQRFYIVTSP
jgi:hypothetical protein